MTEVKNSSVDLLTRQMSGSRKKDEKAVDGNSGFKMMLKNRNQKKDSESTEAKESGKDTEAVAAETAASMMAAGMTEAQNPDDMSRITGQELLKGLAGGVQAVVSGEDEKIQTMSPFQSLDQFRLQKLNENTEEIPPVFSDNLTDTPVNGLVEKMAVPGKTKVAESANQINLKQDQAIAGNPEDEKNVLADQLLKGTSAAIPDKTEDEPALTIQSGKPEEKKVFTEKDEKKQDEPLGVFQEKSQEPNQPLHIQSEKDGIAYTTVSAENLEELEGKLSEQILKQIHAGKSDLDVQLEPHNLGKIRIKVTYEDNEVSVSVLCTESKTLKLLSQSAGDLGSILESRLERPVQILVDKQEADYLNNQQEQGSRQEQQQHQGSGKEENREDFIQKLRLGIFETDSTDESNTNYR